MQRGPAIGLLASLLASGGCLLPTPPEIERVLEANVAELQALESRNESIVRVYREPITETLGFATHTFFITRRAGDSEWGRFEFEIGRSLEGHVFKNRGGAREMLRVDRQAEYLITELTGEPADAVLDLLEATPASYPCWYTYRALPGPNSNTFVAWILQQAGTPTALPWNAFGAAYPADCHPQTPPPPEVIVLTGAGVAAPATALCETEPGIEHIIRWQPTTAGQMEAEVTFPGPGQFFVGFAGQPLLEVFGVTPQQPLTLNVDFDADSEFGVLIAPRSGPDACVQFNARFTPTAVE